MAAGDVSDLMITELGQRLEDATPTKFTSAVRFSALNDAQRRLSILLDRRLLTELEDISTDVSISTGSYALSSLNSGGGVLKGKNGILRISVDIGAAGSDLWATEFDIAQVKINENTYFKGSDTNPRYYIVDGAIKYLVTTLTATTSTIYFLKYPTTMTTDVDPELNEAFRHLIVDLAEAQCWGIDSQFERKQSVLAIAMEEIKIVNSNA